MCIESISKAPFLGVYSRVRVLIMLCCVSCLLATDITLPVWISRSFILSFWQASAAKGLSAQLAGVYLQLLRGELKTCLTTPANEAPLRSSGFLGRTSGLLRCDMRGMG